MEVVPGGRYLSGMADRAQVGCAGFSDQSGVGHILLQRVPGPLMAGDTAIATVDCFKKGGVVDEYGLPTLHRGHLTSPRFSLAVRRGPFLL
jgi:hypothetical protein